MNAGAIVAAQIAATQKAIMTELREAGATRRDTATAYQRPDGGKGKIFDGLIKHGLVEKTGKGHFFLTEKGRNKLDRQDNARYTVPLILLIAFSLCASAIALLVTLAD
ncbi:hypothetical protein [Sphingomicrobium marinum]|uniref:hypothetical protein n=1 Tax=Sphingomicrobium marinum TaxID=1227950 RepID=UPI0022404911|nr:hypothetical protein [Sphingomicrobium marinum]